MFSKIVSIILIMSISVDARSIHHFLNQNQLYDWSNYLDEEAPFNNFIDHNDLNNIKNTIKTWIDEKIEMNKSTSTHVTNLKTTQREMNSSSTSMTTNSSSKNDSYKLEDEKKQIKNESMSKQEDCHMFELAMTLILSLILRY
jgi:hypothetical protein